MPAIRRTSLWSCAGFVLSVGFVRFAAVAAHAANLVENPDFSDALEGWSVGPAGAISLKASDGLPSAPSRPTPNPDAARDFIELHSACGRKHVEFQGGGGSPEFQRLLAALDSLTSVR